MTFILGMAVGAMLFLYANHRWPEDFSKQLLFIISGSVVWVTAVAIVSYLLQQ